jgi:hypothetical protein
VKDDRRVFFSPSRAALLALCLISCASLRAPGDDNILLLLFGRGRAAREFYQNSQVPHLD